MEHANGGTAEKGRFVFHHDGNVTVVGTFQGEPVVVGRMQRVPAKLNGLAHVGSAAITRTMGVSKKLAKEINELARMGKGPLIKLGNKIAKAIAKSAPRLGRMIPVLGGLITLYYFADEVEAHGLDGALLRATPLLGDVVTAYDIGSDLATHIRSQAEQEAQSTIARVNEQVAKAQSATIQAVADAINQVAETIRITKRYIQPEEVLEAVKDAMAGMYGEIYPLYLRKFQSNNPPSDSEIEGRIKSAIEQMQRQLETQLQEPPEVRPQKLI